MEKIVFETPVMWSQLDVNGHLRHSAYGDFATQARITLLKQTGMPVEQMTELQIGPVLFREEILYHREVRPADTVRVSCLLQRATQNGSKWAFVQKLYRSDDVLAATVTVEGAWLDLQKRKLTPLPDTLSEAFRKLEKTNDFAWL